MRLTLHSDYALRVLLHLGARDPQRISIREIAESYRISENHLVKVVHRLGQGGFVRTFRGQGGGLNLARPAQDIRIGDVVRFTEDDMALVACFDGSAQTCVLAGACGLQGVLHDALAAFMTVLDGRTLADLLRPPDIAAMTARLIGHAGG